MDAVSPSYVFPMFQTILDGLPCYGYLSDFRSYSDNLLVALDGTEYFSSNKICCADCSQTHYGNGSVRYSHNVITPVLIKPGNDKVISLQPEFIIPQDGHKKQDSETAAAKRWEGKKQFKDTYRFVNTVPLRNEESMEVNWCELKTIQVGDQSGKAIYFNTFATNFEITKENVIQIVADGRARWKIENENNNVLKTKGYHLEHNFGHGKQHLSSLLLTLNLLAFLFHTVLELSDETYCSIREKLPTRKIKHIGNSAKNQRDNTGCLNYVPSVKRPAQQDYRNTNPIKKQKAGIYLPTHKKKDIDDYTLRKWDG